MGDFPAFWAHYSPDILDRLSRVVVPLHWIVRVPQQDGELAVMPQYATGFLARLDSGHVLWVTAGHVLKGIKEQVGAQMPLKFRLCDGLARPMPGREGVPVPISFDGESGTCPAFFVDDDKCGIDVGMLALRPIVSQPLLAHGDRPLAPMRVAKPTRRFHFYCVLGAPRKAYTPTMGRTATGGFVNSLVACPLIPLRRLRALRAWRTDVPRMHFEPMGEAPIDLADENGLLDASGMSGGPIVGVRVGRKYLSLYLVAVQAAQDRFDNNRRVLHATPAWPFFQATVAHLQPDPAPARVARAA
ncbi:MAG: hypothetical protein ACKVS8_03545 [Phycisphaerales bacterium]